MDTGVRAGRGMARFFTRRVVAAVGAIALVVGAVAGAAVAFIAGGGSSPPDTAVVRRTDLTMSADGTLGYDGLYAIAAPSGTSALRVTQARQAVAQDQQALAGDEQTESDESPARSGAGNAAGNGAGKDAAARSAYDQAQNRVLSDQTRLRGDRAVLGALQSTAVNPGTVYTWLPSAGDVIRQDQPVYSVSGRPVPLLYGSGPAYRAFYPGMSDGPDVHQLNRDLVSLRFGKKDTAKSSQYSQQTVQAVERWQSSLGLPKTGKIPLGGAVFEPGPIRVASVAASIGGQAGGSGGGSGTVLKATATTPVAIAALGPDVKPGTAVSVTTPGGGLAMGGHVKKVVGQTATIALDGTPPASDVAEKLPVSVSVNSRQVRHALSVSVNALVPLPGGGQGLNVVTGDGSLRLREVTPGLRAGTQVQVRGPGITDGTTVALPAAG